jgi:hypothetical protein
MPIQQDLGLGLVVSTICSSLFLAHILRLDPRFKLFVSLRLDAALVLDLHLARH